MTNNKTILFPGTRFPSFLVLFLLVLISDSSKRCELCDEVKISQTEHYCEKCLSSLDQWGKEDYKEDIVKIEDDEELNDIANELSLGDSLTKRCELCYNAKIPFKEEHCEKCLASMDKWNKEDAAKLHGNESKNSEFNLTGQKPLYISQLPTSLSNVNLCKLCGEVQISFKEQHCHSCIRILKQCEEDTVQKPLSNCIMCQKQIPCDTDACEECKREQQNIEVLCSPNLIKCDLDAEQLGANTDDNDGICDPHAGIDLDMYDQAYDDNALNYGALRRKYSDDEEFYKKNEFKK